MSAQNKIYIGFAKQIEFSNGGNVIKITLNENDLKKLQENLVDGKVRLQQTKRKEADKWGNTHSLEIDTWKPTQKSQPALPVQQAQKVEERFPEINDNGEEIPF